MFSTTTHLACRRLASPAQPLDKSLRRLPLRARCNSRCAITSSSTSSLTLWAPAKVGALFFRRNIMRRSGLLFLAMLVLALFAKPAAAQRDGNRSLFGDVHITGADNNPVSQEVTLILRRTPDGEVGRQVISSRGRYRFNNLPFGEYEIVIESDGKEIGRTGTIYIRERDLSSSPYGFQYD